MLDSEIPEWLQEFRENLVDDEIPLQGDSHASSSHEVSLEPTTKRREDLGKHSVYTRFPNDRNCEICKRTKISRAPCRRRNGEAVPRAEIFADLITADHKVLSDNCESRNNHRYAVVVQDLATQWIQAYPCRNKTSRNPEKLAKVPGAREEDENNFNKSQGVRIKYEATNKEEHGTLLFLRWCNDLTRQDIWHSKVRVF